MMTGASSGPERPPPERERRPGQGAALQTKHQLRKQPPNTMTKAGAQRRPTAKAIQREINFLAPRRPR
jgi:hypothetical protein